MTRRLHAVTDVRPSWPGRSVSVGGYVLHVRRAGDPGGESAVLVHGLSGSSTNWTDLMGELGDLDCHAPDLPGFGRSAPPRSWSLDEHVRAVVAYIESVDRGPVHLFGNSLGGAVSTRLAAERPDLVRTLTLVSPALPAYKLSRQSDPRLGLLLLPGLNKVAQYRMSRAPAEARAAAIIDLCHAHPEAVTAERRQLLVDEMERRMHLPWSASALEGSLRGLVRSYLDPQRNLFRQAAQVTAPVLLIQGSADRLVPVAVARRAEQVFPDCRLHVLDDVGHVAQMEVPELVAGLVREFLAEAVAVPA